MKQTEMRWTVRRSLVRTLFIAGVAVATAAGLTAAAPARPMSASADDAAITAQLEGLEYQLLLDEAEGAVEVLDDGSIVQTIEGQQMVFSQDGTWTVSDVPAPGEVAPQYVSGCVGSFAPIIKVAGYLQTGATQTCTEGAYPQWISYQLRSTCAGPLCLVFSNETGRIRSNNGLGYNRVANVTYTENCASSGKRQYQQIVWPTGRGVQFGPVVDTNEPTVSCDLNA